MNFSSTDRFVTLLVTIIIGLSIIAGGIRMTLRALWDIRGSWDATNGKLESLIVKVTDIATNAQNRDDRLENRIERHEDWHARYWDKEKTP